MSDRFASHPTPVDHLTPNIYHPPDLAPIRIHHHQLMKPGVRRRRDETDLTAVRRPARMRRPRMMIAQACQITPVSMQLIDLPADGCCNHTPSGDQATSVSASVVSCMICSSLPSARLREFLELTRNDHCYAVGRQRDMPKRREQLPSGRSVQMQLGTIKQSMVEAVEIMPLAGDHERSRRSVAVYIRDTEIAITMRDLSRQCVSSRFHPGRCDRPNLSRGPHQSNRYRI